MTDANLVIGVDSRQVTTGTKSLDDLAAAGGRAEKSTNALTKATNVLANAARVAAGAFGLYKIAQYAQEATMLAARYETMGIVMHTAGRNAGYAASEMDKFAVGLQKSGISMLQSRDAMTQLATANISLTKAAEIGRAAQNLAVVANVNSSEAMARMIHGIKSGQVEVLRTLGLNVNFEESYKTLATQLNKTISQLTEEEKALARTNAALEGAAKFNGIYEESMKTAGKAMGSLARLTQDFALEVGKPALTVFTKGVFAAMDGMKVLSANISTVTAALGGLAAATGAWIALNAAKATYTFATALIASRVAALAAAQAEVARVAGNVAGARAALINANATLAQATAAYGAATANNAAAAAAVVQARASAGAAAANLAKATSDTAGAGAALAHAGANATLTGSLIAATVAMKAFLLSNPIGWATLAIGAGVTAWLAWGNEAEKAGTKGKVVITEATEVLARWLRIHKERKAAAEAEAEVAKKAAEAKAEVAKKAAEAHQKSINSMIASLRKEADTYGMAEAEIKRYEMALLKMSPVQKAAAEAALARIDVAKWEEASRRRQADMEEADLQRRRRANDELVKAAQDAEAISRGLSTGYRKEGEGRARAAEYALMSASGRAYAQVMDNITESARAASAALQLRFPTEAEQQAVAYKKAVEDIKTAHDDAAKSAADWAVEQDRLNASWEHGASKAMKSYLDTVRNVAKQTESMMTKAFTGMEDALVKFVRTGKLDFASLADSIVNDMIRMQIQQSITSPLTRGISGGFGNLLGSFFGGSAPTGMAGFSPEQMAGPVMAFEGGGFTGSGGRTGGVDGRGGFPAILHPNETVIDHTKDVRGGGSNVVVNVIESPRQGGQTQQRNEGGVNIVDVFVAQVKSAIASDITRGIGDVPAALSQTYGMNRVAGAY